MFVKEITFITKDAAYAHRRDLVNNGYNVSLIAFDPDRNLYVFDYWK